MLASIIVAIILFSFQPKNVVNQPDSYNIFRVTHNGEDITNQIDCHALQQILSSYKCHRFPLSFGPYQTSQIIIEINGYADGRPLHILLGEINIAYSSGSKGGFTIIKSEELLKEIISLIP